MSEAEARKMGQCRQLVPEATEAVRPLETHSRQTANPDVQRHRNACRSDKGLKISVPSNTDDCLTYDATDPLITEEQPF